MIKHKLRDCTLEEKTFLTILIFSIGVSVICIIGNIVIGFDFAINYKWIAMIIIAIVSIKLYPRKEYVKPIQIFVFSIIIFVFVPSGWITSGGANNFTIAYAFIICITICYVFNGRMRLFFIVAEILVLLSLIYIEYAFPNLIYFYDRTKNLKDMMIQIPLTLGTAAYIITTFSNAYRNERKKLKEYGELLNEKNKMLERISKIVELTGIYNRRHIFEKLNEFHELMHHINMKISIIMIDIDNFKQINDKYGHIFGDELLKVVSEAIVKIIGEKGIVGRYGGDEFIVILEDTTVEDSKNIINELMVITSCLDIDKEVEITLSGGMAVLDKFKDIDEVLTDADNLLYKVKHNGKNNILIEEERVASA